MTDNTEAKREWLRRIKEPTKRAVNIPLPARETASETAGVFDANAFDMDHEDRPAARAMLAQLSGTGHPLD